MQCLRGVSIFFVLLALGLYAESTTTTTTTTSTTTTTTSETTGGHRTPLPNLVSSSRVLAWTQCPTLPQIARTRWRAPPGAAKQQQQPRVMRGRERRTWHMHSARSSASSSSSSSPVAAAAAALESPAWKDCGYASGLVWPGNSGTFEECCAIAMETNTTLTMLRGSVAWVRDNIRLRGNRQQLRIRGETAEEAAARGRRGAPIPSVRGDAHSLFQITGKYSQLLLSGLELNHMASAADKKDVGSAVFALSWGRARLEGCIITSMTSFAVWAVQQSRIQVINTTVGECGRSGIVAFGKAGVEISGSAVINCKIHGVCARGRASIQAVDSLFAGNNFRGIYCYHNVTCMLSGVEVKGTRNGTFAAVEVSSLREEDTTSLVMERCNVHANAGKGVWVRGNVHPFTVTSCTIKDNQGGNVVESDAFPSEGGADDA